MIAFDKIIGYASVKRELMQISDTLKNTHIYKELGVCAPRGLLLYGEPGVGKSLMAETVIEASGVNAFICRKDKPNRDFVKQIKATFDKAATNAPSIVYLDDMDKFANVDDRYKDAEEYVTVQSCIDEVKGKQVFVLATANDLSCLPRSLYRAGRFDRIIKIEAPKGDDAEKVISHYLSEKQYVDNIDPAVIARIMDGRSCAELETVINEAGIYAGFEQSKSITMEHFLKACLKTIFDVPVEALGYEDDGLNFCTLPSNTGCALSQVVCHESGHAVISEILCPESVTLISAYHISGKQGGFTSYYHNADFLPLFWLKSRIISSLGGIAAIEQKFGLFDAGCDHDLDRAFDMSRNMVVNNCVCGLYLHEDRYGASEQLKCEQEKAVACEVEKYYRKAKEILSLNHDFFDKIAAALTQKGLLSSLDIKRIKNECEIILVTL